MNWLQQALWWGSLLIGSSHIIAFSLPQAETLKVVIFSKGRQVQECTIAPGSIKQKKLSLWFSQNAKSWSATAATYAPNVQVSGQKFSVNFRDSSAILNYDRGQYFHAAGLSDYAYLLCDDRI